MSGDTVLEFTDIRQAFASPGGGPSLTVLDGISFKVRKGEFVAVIGPSGCGKSTLLQMAAGLLVPTAGQASQDGQPIVGVNRRVGLVPQQAQLYPWKTLLQNVEFPLALRGVPAAERRARAEAAIAAVDLRGFEHHWPWQLSGGMQKRASIARTLVYGPDVILMDEPFGALDAQTKMTMQSDLQALVAKSGAAVLFVTHDITEAIMLADQVVVLSRRPTRLLATVPITLPRPRNVFEPFSVPGFAETYDQVWQLFRGEIEARKERRMKGRVLQGLLKLLPGVVLLIAWEWASGRMIREAYVSKPSAVAERLVQLFGTGEVWPNLIVTGQELVWGYVIGSAAGIVCGYLLGRMPRLAAVVEPYLMAFYGIPKIALAPLLIIWFGIGVGSKIALAATMVFFLLFYTVFAAVRTVDRELVNLALVMGARESQLGRHVYLPAAMPAIMLGLRMAVPYAVIGVIAGEFASALKGLGLYINYSSSTYDPAGVFAGIVILLVFVLAANSAAAWVERRVLRWRPPQVTQTGSP